MVREKVTGEQVCFPFASQAARLYRNRENRKPQSVCLLSSHLPKELSAERWLELNIAHWSIETGLHSRLDISRHDDRCRLRADKPLRLHGIFARIANSICCEWLLQKNKPQNFTSEDFRKYMSQEHDRKAILTILSKRPNLSG